MGYSRTAALIAFLLSVLQTAAAILSEKALLSTVRRCTFSRSSDESELCLEQPAGLSSTRHW